MSTPPASSLAPIAVSLKKATLAYQGHLVQQELQGDILQGSMTAIIGANGTGKSTLIKAISGLIKPHSGSIKCQYPKEKIAYLAQICDIDRSFPMTVVDFIACGLWNQTGIFKSYSDDHLQQIDSILSSVGMKAHRNKLIGELSGGQFQRVRFAQLALQDAELYLLDEPFSGIDEQTVTDLMCLLHYWSENGKTIMAVLHDLELVKTQFPQVIVLGEQQLLGWGETTATLAEQQKDAPLQNTEHLTLIKEY